MTQITSGVRAVLSNASVYSLLQHLLGSHRARQTFVAELVKPVAGMRVLDIGCGPASILPYLPEVDYHGFDISERYIERARQRFGARGTFYAAALTEAEVDRLPAFDLVLAMAVLHHMDDDTARSTLRLADRALAPGGRLLTLDPCLHPGQHPIARFLARHDRGQHVRDQAGYAALASAVFEAPRVEIRHGTRGIPYTHCWMACTATTRRSQPTTS